MLQNLRSFGIVPVMLLSLSLTACHKPATPTVDTTPAPTGPTTVALTEKDAGRTINLHPGDTLQVTLAGNPSTGFGWYAPSLDTKILKQEGDWEFKSADSSPAKVGAPGTLTLKFSTAGSGRTALHLVYHQPWDSKTPPAHKFDVTVVVGKK
jgi:inhibitor of cysteine peptidase